MSESDLEKRCRVWLRDTFKDNRVSSEAMLVRFVTKELAAAEERAREAEKACEARGFLLDEHRKGCAWQARAAALEALLGEAKKCAESCKGFCERDGEMYAERECAALIERIDAALAPKKGEPK